jgi:hypothetical protein
MASRYARGEIDADQFQRELLLHPERGETFLVRLLQLWRGFGLTHSWMYDWATAAERVERAGFVVIEGVETPSSWFRANDDASLHVVGIKRARDSS